MNPLSAYRTSCGHLSETDAAQAHALVQHVYEFALITGALSVLSLVGALACEAAMRTWHRASVETHERRAAERGEA